jgi:hypothetical protein
MAMGAFSTVIDCDGMSRQRVKADDVAPQIASTSGRLNSVKVDLGGVLPRAGGNIMASASCHDSRRRRR